MSEDLCLDGFSLSRELEFRFSVGGLTCLVVSDDQYFIDRLGGDFSGFVSDSEPDFRVEVKRCGGRLEDLGTVRLEENPVVVETSEGVVRYDHIREDAVDIDFEGDSIVVSRHDFNGFFRVDEGFGRVVFNYTPARTAYNVFAVSKPFRDFIRVCFCLMLLERDGFMIHSSAVDLEGCGVLFSGPANAGKTTIARISGLRVLNEDFNVVRRVGGRVFVYSTPFGGDEKSEDCRLVLDKVFFIEKSGRDRAEVLSETDSLLNFFMNELLTMSVHFGRNQLLCARIFNNVSQVVEGLDCYHLDFRKDVGVWDLIRSM